MSRRTSCLAVLALMVALACGGEDSSDGESGSGGAGGTAGVGGAAGSGGVGGIAGSGGTAGAGGVGVGGVDGDSMCESAEECDDGNECTTDSCSPVDRICEYVSIEGDCDVDGVPGTCLEGVCVPVPQWGTPLQISPENTAVATAPRVASDANGNAIAVWQQYDNTATYHIWARRFTRAAGWATAERISNGASAADHPRIAMDSAGNAIVVWSQFERKVTDLLTIHNIWANRFTSTGGWGTPVVIEDNAGNAVGPDVAMNPNGVAMVVWHQYPDGNGYQNIWARKHDPVQGWDIPRAVELNSENSSQPRPAVDADGNAFAVWVQKGDIWTGRYTAANGWGTSEPLTDAGTGASGPVVAADDSGNAIAVWGRNDCTTTCNVWAARYVLGSGWAIPEAINGQGRWAYAIDMSIDNQGTAIALWAQSDGTRPNIWNNRYSPHTGWGSAALVEQSSAGAGQPALGFDAQGNAIAVWYENNASAYSIQAANFTPSGGWNVSERIDDGVILSDAPDVAVSPDGRATAVWYQFDGLNYSIWSNRYE